MQLRPYQTKAVRDLMRLFGKLRRVVAVAPTGSGKTTIAAALLRKWPNKRVLWVAHRIELIRQARDHLIEAGIPAAEIGILTGPEKSNLEARVLVVSIDTLRGMKSADAQVVVIDEAHRSLAASYLTVLEGCPNALVLGLTATPWRLDGESLGDVFEHLLVMAEAVDLIGNNWLAKPVCYGLPEKQECALTKGVAAGKEFAQAALSRSMSKRSLMGEIIGEWQRIAKNRRTIVYAVNHAHAAKLYKRFRRAKVAAEYLCDGVTDAERSAILGRLKTGETRVVVNVDMLSEGYDCPNVECIVLARPTKSLTRFLQQCGRAARPNGKQIIIDHAGNTRRFGYPHEPRIWSLEGKATSGNGESPLKTCCNDDCRFKMATGCRECPECGTAQPLSERELSEQQVELERLKVTERERERIEKAARQIAKERGYPEKWVRDVLKGHAT